MMTKTRSTAHVSPEEALRRGRKDAAFATATALSKTGETREETAAALDCSASRISAFVDAESGATMCIARARMLPPSAARVIAEYVAGPAHMVIERPNGAELDLKSIATAQRSTSGLVTELLEALADGHMSASEARKLRPLVTAVVENAQAVLAACDMAERERVIPIVRGVA
jgi:hypothetical protein